MTDERHNQAVQAAALWRQRMAAPGWSGEDDAAFEAWMAEDDLHPRAFERSGKVWDFVDHHAASPELMVIRRDALDRAQRTARGRLPRRGIPRRAALAAAIAAVAVLAGGAYLHQRGEVYSTGRNERRIVNLDDGSRVSLDAMSRVAVKYSPGARRLTLEHGQARFDVAHDAARPFSVRARSKTVVATGTAFNIDVFGQTARVTLIEGKVLVLAAKPLLAPEPTTPAKPIAMRAGEQLLVPDDAPPKLVASVDLQQATAWQQGKLMFDNTPLADAVAQVNRYSERKITVGDAAAAATPVSGAFDAGNARGFLEAVTSYLPLTATDGPHGVVLSAAGRGG